MNVTAATSIHRPTRSSTRRSPTAGNRGQGSNWLRRATRRRIYTRDRWRCVWCLCEIAQIGMHGVKGVSVNGIVFTDGLQLRQASVDHVVSRSRGGSNRPSNLIACCMRCNAKRGHRSVPKFAKALCDEAGLRNGFYLSPSKIVRRVRAAQRRKLPDGEKKNAQKRLVEPSYGSRDRLRGLGDPRSVRGDRDVQRMVVADAR